MTDCERWVWTSPVGIERELTAFVNSTEVLLGMSNRYAPPAVITRQVVPNTSGARTQSRRHDVRPLQMPLGAVGANITALQSVLAGIASDMNIMAGMGTLTYIGLDAHESTMQCVQTAQLDPNAVQGVGKAFMTTKLVFESDDPYFYGSWIQQSFVGSNPGSWFPGLPWALGGSAVIGAETLDITSDVETWPYWYIVGPGSDPMATNNTTGETWALSATLGSGDTVVIDTSLGVKTVIGPGGSNWFSKLTQRSLWPLVPFSNDITLSLSGATSDSFMTLMYKPRTLAP